MDLKVLQYLSFSHMKFFQFFTANYLSGAYNSACSDNKGDYVSQSILIEPDYEAGTLNIEVPIEVVETSPDLNAE